MQPLFQPLFHLLFALVLLAGCGGTQEIPPTPQPSPTPAQSTPLPTLSPTPLPAGVAPTPPAGQSPLATPLSPMPTGQSQPPLATPAAPAAEPQRFTYRVVARYPHDPGAFTQGLLYADGYLYESTGRRGQSTLRRVDLVSGEVVQMVRLGDQYFGEGLALWQDRFYQLTWTSNVGFVYDRESLAEIGRFTYPTEGWGLTHDGRHLILSDGSDLLYFYEPEGFELAHTLAVRLGDRPLLRLNELEYIRGEVYANVWGEDFIVAIDPHSGQVTRWIDLSDLLPPEERAEPGAVLNGIAYDAVGERLFVTGKLWPTLFWIELVAE